MPTKREVLDLLTRDELFALADKHSVLVVNRRSRADLVEGLVVEAPTLRILLADFSSDRLKKLCRALNLQGDSQAKTVLLAQLAENAKSPLSELRKPARTANTPPSAARSGPSGTRDSLKSTIGGERLDLDIGAGKLTVETLQQHLWAAAEILRGAAAASDYKNYLFCLILLKRLSDCFDEECEALLGENINPEDHDEHPVFVPKRARWASLQKVPTNIGDAINKACSELEDENKSLEGVFSSIDFNDELKLGNTRNRDRLLAELLRHFSMLNLRNNNLSEPETLGSVCDQLIESFADDAGWRGGEFRTPKGVADLVVELLAPREGMRICDPTCGSGGMLLACAAYVRKHGGDPQNLSLFGQEKNAGTWALCKMNTLFRGRLDDRIEKGDTIRNPKLLNVGQLMVFDRVLANPPFSLKEWGHEVAERDGFGRFAYGVPPKSKGDLAFLQHMVATMNDKGMVGVVVPHGVLFRGAAEGEIRRRMLERDLFEAVINLPPNLFYGTGISAAILIINKAKSPNRKSKVLFIDASHGFLERPTKNRLRKEDTGKVIELFRAYKDIHGLARVVDIQEIGQQGWSLSVSRHIQTSDEPRPGIQSNNPLREIQANFGVQPAAPQNSTSTPSDSNAQWSALWSTSHADRDEDFERSLFTSHREANFPSLPFLRKPVHPGELLYAFDPEDYQEQLANWYDQERSLALAQGIFPEVQYEKNRARFEQLEQRVARKKVIPFVGAGVSASYRFPTWAGYLEKLAAEAGFPRDRLVERLTAGQFEEAADDLLYILNENGFSEAFRRHFTRTPNAKNGGLVDYILMLAVDGLVTTNFDSLLESSPLSKFTRILMGTSPDGFTALVRRGDRVLLKLHGDIVSPRARILTKKEYDDAYGNGNVDESRPLPRILKETYLENTFLFVGCSLGTDRTMQLFAQVAGGSEPRDAEHFAILESPLEGAAKFPAREQFLSARNIYPIWYPYGQHEYVRRILKLLVRSVKRSAPQ